MEKLVLGKVFDRLALKPFAVTYWDGSTETYGEGDPRFRIIFNKPLPKKEMLDDPSLALGEAYMDGNIDYEGDIREILDLAYRNKEVFAGKEQIINILTRLKPTSLKKQKSDVQYHYDLGNDFYQLWLDETMSYSCAYFKQPDNSLYQAQVNKIMHILKKLNLSQGESLLDIGCGWGELIIRAARQYGAKALGITLSEEQYKKTKERIKNENLEGTVDVQLVDYRELADAQEKFDKVVSVGMIEHVGSANIPEYFKAANKLLNPGGIFLLHSITKQVETETNPWIEKYIFPGGYIPSVRELFNVLPDYDFHLADAESLRLHYAKTLEYWAVNFEKNLDKVKEKFDNRFIRMWRIYLNSCVAAFRYSVVDIHQVILVKGLNNNIPMTRDYMYK